LKRTKEKEQKKKIKINYLVNSRISSLNCLLKSKFLWILKRRKRGKTRHHKGSKVFILSCLIYFLLWLFFDELGYPNFIYFFLLLPFFILISFILYIMLLKCVMVVNIKIILMELFNSVFFFYYWIKARRKNK